MVARCGGWLVADGGWWCYVSSCSFVCVCTHKFRQPVFIHPTRAFKHTRSLSHTHSEEPRALDTIALWAMHIYTRRRRIHISLRVARCELARSFVRLRRTQRSASSSSSSLSLLLSALRNERTNERRNERIYMRVYMRLETLRYGAQLAHNTDTQTNGCVLLLLRGGGTRGTPADHLRCMGATIVGSPVAYDASASRKTRRFHPSPQNIAQQQHSTNTPTTKPSKPSDRIIHSLSTRMLRIIYIHVYMYTVVVGGCSVRSVRTFAHRSKTSERG